MIKRTIAAVLAASAFMPAAANAQQIGADVRANVGGAQNSDARPDEPQYRAQQHGDRQARRAQGRDDRQNPNPGLRDDGAAYRDGQETQQQVRPDARGDQRNFGQDRRSDDRDFAQGRAGDRRAPGQDFRADGRQQGGYAPPIAPGSGAYAGRGYPGRDDRNRGYGERGYGDRGYGDRGYDDRGETARGHGYGARGGYAAGGYGTGSYGAGGYGAGGYGAGSYGEAQRGGWNRSWRSDPRYDWARYRTYNRGLYRLPRYYAPANLGYGYRRFSVGVVLSAGLFGQSYWLNDPYSYRLPEAYGPYRWVRYYNDALLVDIRSGYVVDTAYGIFY